MQYCIVTGSGGLVGSETVRFFSNVGYNVIGIDNDMRKYFSNAKNRANYYIIITNCDECMHVVRKQLCF